MKESFSTKLYGWFYGNSCKKQLKKEISADISREYKNIVRRAKDIGSSRLLSAYCMGAYFIALNRCTKLSAEENYEIFKKGLYENKLFRKVLGNAENYLDAKKLPGRLEWAENSQKRRYENDWVVEVLPGTGEYDLGYDYLECGVCKLCRDEGCPELAKYLCRLDFVLADIMGMELKRTETIAEGGEKCDFRYRKK